MTPAVPTRKPRHILIVDDDPDIRGLLAEVLVNKGYSVNLAGDGAEALEMLELTLTDAVLLDLHMPGMDGYEFLVRRDSNSMLAKIPVIIMTGADQRPATRAGTSVLDKPIRGPALLAMLARSFLPAPAATNG